MSAATPVLISNDQRKSEGLKQEWAEKEMGDSGG